MNHFCHRSDRIFEFAVYFEPSNIRIWMFLSLIPDRSELKAAIRSLHDQTLVIFSENTESFVVSKPARVKHMFDLKRTGMDEWYLKRTLSFLETAKPSYFSHFASVFQHAKQYPRLLKDLGDLPGRMLRGMIDAKRYTAAVDCGMEWIKSLNVLLSGCHWTVLHLRSRLGLALLERGKNDEALNMLLDVYRKTCNAFGEAEVIDIMTVLSEVFIRADPKRQSEDNLRQVVFNGKKVSECKDNSQFHRWVHYAIIISKFDLAKEGISILQEVIKCRRRIFGPRDEKINNIMVAKAKILASMARFSDSLKILQKVDTIRRNKYGIMDPKTLKTKISRGNVMVLQGKLEEALALFKQVTERSIIPLGYNHILSLIAKTEIVQTYVLQRNFGEALEHCAGVHDKLIAVYGRVHPQCFVFRKRMGDIMWELNKRHKALIIFKELLEDFENSYEKEADLQALRRRTEGIESSLFKAGWGTLHMCAKRGDSIAIANLIASGWDVDGKDSTDLTPLHYASAFGQIEVARLLLQKGANYASVSKDGSTPHDVTREPEMLQLLETAQDFFKGLEDEDMHLFNEAAGKEPCLWGAKDHKRETLLFEKARLGFVESVVDLLDLGVNPNAMGTYEVLFNCKGTPLIAAAYNGHIEVVKVLVKRGVLKARLNRTVLHAAAESGNLDLVKYLLAHGAVYCARDSGQQMPRQRATDPAIKNLLRFIEGLFNDAKKGKVKRLLARLREMEDGEVAAVAGAKNDELRTLVQVASKQGYNELVRKLVKKFKTK